jgi:hypothetical protein
MASKKNGVARVASLRYWQVEDARVAVEAWKASGERLPAFAKRHGIKPRRLRQWATRLEAAEEITFHPVRVVESRWEEKAQGNPIEIVMGEGRTVRVPPGFHIQDLERVLSVLSVLEGSAGC